MPDEKEATEKTSRPKTEEIENRSSCNLKVGGVLIRKGESASVKKFDPDNAINASWIASKMIVVK